MRKIDLISQYLYCAPNSVVEMFFSYKNSTKRKEKVMSKGFFTAVLFLAVILPMAAWAGDFYPCKGDVVEGIDTKPSHYCGKGVIVFVTSEEVGLAIKFLEEYVAFAPENDPFLFENKGLLEKIRGFSKIPTEIDTILSLAQAQREAEGISHLKIEPLQVIGRN